MVHGVEAELADARNALTKLTDADTGVHVVCLHDRSLRNNVLRHLCGSGHVVEPALWKPHYGVIRHPPSSVGSFHPK